MKRKAALCLLTAAIAAVSFALPTSVARAEGNGEQSDSGSASAETVKVWFGANEEENAVLEEIAERFEQETGIAVVSRGARFSARRPIWSTTAQLKARISFIFRRRISGRSLRIRRSRSIFSTGNKSRFTDVPRSARLLDGLYGVGYNSTWGLPQQALISRKLKTWDEFFSV